MPLTDTTCRTVKPVACLRKLSDGGGLQLWVQPTGSKLWRVAYRFGGKQKLVAVGSYPVITLADARRAREDAKRLLANGVDPSAAKKTIQREARGAMRDSFRAIAEEYVEKLKRERRADITVSKTAWLLSFAYPTFGDRPVRNIGAPEILDVLRNVERRGHHETARRLRSTIGRVFRYAVATARADNDPTFALQGALTRPTITPRAAITDPVEFGTLLHACWSYKGSPQVAAALKLMGYLFPRPGELRQAEWSAFDLDTAVWAIPGHHTKMRRPHRVPLPPKAVTVLRDLQGTTGTGKLVFPSANSATRCISENTMGAALRRLGYARSEASAHGFRATASTLLNESGLWHPDAIERALAHVEENGVRRAYARGEHWEERVRMAAWWADYCDGLREKAA